MFYQIEFNISTAHPYYTLLRSFDYEGIVSISSQMKWNWGIAYMNEYPNQIDTD